MTQAFISASSSSLEETQSRNEHLSEQVFEMCQMFSQQRPDIEDFAIGFSISNTVEQMGEQQLLDSVDNMIRKENSAAVNLR